MLSGQGKWVGAGTAVALAPETGGLSAAILASLLGGAGGEAAEQLGKRATGVGDVPETSGEAAKKIAIGGMETASAEFLWGGAQRLGAAALRHFNPYTQGIQSLFRAFGPPSAPEFRTALQDSAWDLQRIYSSIDKRLASPDVQGGVINEDMRFRVTLDAVEDYLRDMYRMGRQAQIQVGEQYGSRVVLEGNPRVLQETALRLARSLPTDSVAQRTAMALARNPMRPVPIAEADELARAVNVELRKFESMTGSEQAAMRMSSKIKAGLKDMDVSLSNGLNNKLHEIGQPGLTDYERRYAALSRVREQLEKGMNKSEAVKWNQRLHSFFSLHGINVRSHFGAFESPGSLLEEGLRRLGKADLLEPGSFRARPPDILQGEIVPEEGMTATPPRAQEVPPGRPGGAAPPPKMITVPDREKQKLLPYGERRATEGTSPTGTERRKGVYASSAYAQPTEGEKLAEDVRQARAGQPHGVTEGDAQNHIKKDPKKWEAYRNADQKTRDRMLVEAKNELVKAKGTGRKGGVKPPPKMSLEERSKIPPTSRITAMGLPYKPTKVEMISPGGDRIYPENGTWRVHFSDGRTMSFFAGKDFSESQVLDEAAKILGQNLRAGVSEERLFDRGTIPKKQDDLDF